MQAMNEKVIISDLFSEALHKIKEQRLNTHLGKLISLGFNIEFNNFKQPFSSVCVRLNCFRVRQVTMECLAGHTESVGMDPGWHFHSMIFLDKKPSNGTLAINRSSAHSLHSDLHGF